VAVIAAATMIPVASPAQQCIVEPTLCFQSGATNASWVPGRGSFVCHHIEKQAERAHVESDQHKAPLHHRRLGVPSELVVRNVRGAAGGNGEPSRQEPIDWLHDHGDSLPLCLAALLGDIAWCPVT
jgi:hypothetical protein